MILRVTNQSNVQSNFALNFVKNQGETHGQKCWMGIEPTTLLIWGITALP